ncbi:MAG: excinuclease ABC subunit UvrA [Acidobacteria bacterium]|nr:excinuclease ABC subunit UvrA [Acidobacteriota bacterium]
MNKKLIIKGIKVHNLKNIDVEIPLGKITVVTGLSGSGKSSLLFDTIYAESSRRFIESIGTYSRQYLLKLPVPDIQSAENIPPSIAIGYKQISRGSRSTVGTSTEIYDYLRLLYAKASETWCSRCNIRIETDSPTEVSDDIIRKNQDQNIVIGFRLGGKDDIESRINYLIRDGFHRVHVNGKIYDMADGSKIRPETTPESLVIADRVKAVEKNSARISEAVEISYRYGDGEVAIISKIGEEKRYSENRVCQNCGDSYPKPTPVMFSFNNPKGACPKCRGFGDIIEYDINKVVPDPWKTISEGAIKPLEFSRFRRFRYDFFNGLKRYGISADKKWHDLTEEEKDLIWNGLDDFEGIGEIFNILERKKYRVDVRVLLAKYRTYRECTECSGSRLQRTAMNYRFGGKTIAEIVRMPLHDLKDFFRGYKTGKNLNKVEAELIEQIYRRLSILCRVGVGYLALNRMTRTLSGGELQRINLTNAVGARLTGTLYLMDEPSIGLHASDEEGLLEIIRNLKNLGNTIVIAEHSKSIIEIADNIIDLGPLAGESGGEITFSGPLESFKEESDSLTAKFITARMETEVPEFRRLDKQGEISIKNARAHNLKGIDIDIPLHRFVTVTGPSGAGKSTLMQEILVKYWKYNYLNEQSHGRSECDKITGLDDIRDIVEITGGDISSSPRATVVTYMGAFQEIRNIFAGLRSAKLDLVEPKHFSFNTKAGRCPECEGRGNIIIDMQFLPEVNVTCEACSGTRFNRKPLKYRYQGKNIAEILSLTTDEALDIFSNQPKITRRLSLLKDLNLSYLKLGQSLDTLSSGEAARLKLARMIARGEIPERLFIFDEPSLGLHPYNIRKLIAVITRLIVNGASVICIDHNLDMIKSSDYVIDLGPGGGERGGRIVAAGTPEELIQNPDSITGKFLSDVMPDKKPEKLPPKPLTKAY